VLDALIDWFKGALDAIAAWVGQWAFYAATAGMEWVAGILPQTIKDFLAADVFTEALALFDDVRYFVPLYSTFTWVAGVLTAVAVIRLARTIVSLIPTWLAGSW